MTDRRDDDGVVTPSMLAALCLTLLLVGSIAQLMVASYGRAVLQAAVEEGARQGLATGSPASCVARVEQVVAAGLGSMAGLVDPAGCGPVAGGVRAEVSAQLPGWPVGAASRQVDVGATAFGTQTGGADRP